MPRLALPHHRFTLLWVLHTLLGIALAYYFERSVDWVLSGVALFGIYCLANLQHLMHYLLGASSTLLKLFPREQYEKKFELLAKIFAFVIGAIAGILVWHRPLLIVFVIIGVAACILYSIKHWEELWGLANIANTIAGYYVASGAFPEIGVVIFVVGFSILCTNILTLYRALTGDYDNIPPPRLKYLARAYLEYVLGLALMIIGLFLM